jgi:RNA polymerase sigma-70 factor, ECF subfamily
MMFFAPLARRAPDASANASAEALLARLRRGDAAALEGLYRREAASVYRYALALSGNSAWAADATQEAFVALATRPEGFDVSRGPLGAYLAGVARHSLAARWRELKREESLDAVAEAEPAASGTDEAVALEAAAASPEALLVQRQDVQALWAALRALPVVFREAVVLVDLQERSYVEAAQIAGIELNTLRTRLHRGRARLAALLGAQLAAPVGPRGMGEKL